MYLLPASKKHLWWPIVKPLLEKAYSKTNVETFKSIGELEDDIAQEYQYCFISSDKSYAGVFDIIEGSRSNVLHFWLSGGEEPEGGWKEVDEFLTKVALVFDCKYIQLEGRLGWKKLTEPLGYSLDSVLMIKEVTNEPISVS